MKKKANKEKNNNNGNNNYNDNKVNEKNEINKINEKDNKNGKENNINEEELEIDKIYSDTLFKYFFKSQKFLNNNIVTDNDLNNIRKIYKGFLEKNADIEVIKEIQNSFIETEVNPILNKIRFDRSKKNIKNRIESLENLVQNLNN